MLTATYQNAQFQRNPSWAPRWFEKMGGCRYYHHWPDVKGALGWGFPADAPCFLCPPSIILSSLGSDYRRIPLRCHALRHCAARYAFSLWGLYPISGVRNRTIATETGAATLLSNPLLDTESQHHFDTESQYHSLCLYPPASLPSKLHPNTLLSCLPSTCPLLARCPRGRARIETASLKHPPLMNVAVRGSTG